MPGWKLCEVLTLAFVRHDPRVAGHVRNGVLASGDVGLSGETLIEYSIKPVCFIDVPVNRVAKLFRSILHEVGGFAPPSARAQPFAKTATQEC